MAWAAALAAGCLLLAGCSATIVGTPTWPGAVLASAALTEAELPTGVRYDPIAENPGDPDGAGMPGPMLSRPEGCSNALTNVIAESAERGPGSALKYAVSFNGARIVMTLLSWNLDMARLSAAAERCATFEAFFDPGSGGIPITTEALPGFGSQALAYRQTMKLGGTSNSVYMALQNVGRLAAFGIAFPVPNPEVEAKAELPQTFLDIFAQQIAKLRSA
jgi:hypothetical protein